MAKVDKRYLKQLYESQIAIDKRFDDAVKSKVNSTGSERAYYDGLSCGLEKGSKYIEACINNYLREL